MTRNHKLYTSHNSPTQGHWAFAMSATLAVIALFAAGDASAANARSSAGLVTNNHTYTGFGNVLNTGEYSSGERSNVHNRPLSIDATANATKETYMYPGQTVITPGTTTYVAPGTAYVTPPVAYTTPSTTTTVIVPKDNERKPAIVNGAATTTIKNQPAVISSYPGDVNARADAGVIVTHPVTQPAPIHSNATGGVVIDTRINP